MAEKVVTRFAPSPTGYLHVGGARTALFNWLWARHNGGTFILRIEDTDQKRNTPTAMQQVINDLRWLGIDWDEGPQVGGPNGPYLQSQRRDIYDRYVERLLDEGKAYYCFETTEELDELRQQARQDSGGFAYQRPAEFPTRAQAEQARAEGRPVTVRFAVPQDQPLVVRDIVRGVISFQPGEITDFIIQKSDGFPTYNFACVVDDYLMRVTHVIRGQEHLMNTPGQQALWTALGFGPPPQYAHMSVTVSDSGGKLSKRERPNTLREALKTMADLDREALAKVGGITVEQLESFLAGESTPDMPAIGAMAAHLGVHLPEINIVDFFKSGYLPETMVNFLALLGWNPGDGREIMQLEELTAAFDIARVSKSNSLFDRNKLAAFNTEHMRRVDKDRLLGHFKAHLRQVASPLAAADDATLARIIRIAEGAQSLEHLDRKSRFLFIDADAIEFDPAAVKKVLQKPGAMEMLALIRQRLAATDEFTEQNLEGMLRGLAEDKQVGLGKVAQPLRVALCGTTVSLPIFDSVQMLGKQNTLARIDATVERFGEHTS
ncbi:MAG TPA: glutamate--tRNA ligase [Phycisphaerales bacterium]|nr:glutamate--tRNA ligase [Phycisphaerales bacterium]